MIRRPLSYLCSACIGGMAFQYFFSIHTWLLYVLVGIFLCIIGLFIFRFCWEHGIGVRDINIKNLPDKYKLIAFTILIGFVFFIGILVFQMAWANEGVLFEAEKRYIHGEGIIIEAEDKGKGKYDLVVKLLWTDLHGQIQGGERVLVRVYEDLESYYKLPGKTVAIEGLVQLPSQRRNPKMFDYRLYLKTINIHTMMEVAPYNLTVIDDLNRAENSTDKHNNYKGSIDNLCKEFNPIMKLYYRYLNWISQVKYIFKANLLSNLDKDVVALVAGMVLGESNMLDDETYEKFQKNGICHILSVSGLHVGTLYACIVAVFGKRRDIFTNIFIMSLLVFYCSLASFAPSAVRASVMIAVHLLGNTLLRRYDMLTGTLVTMLTMLLYNPLMLLNLGFQLSYVAMLTLAIVMPAAMRLCNHKAVAAIVIQVGIAPISAYTFNYFSFVSIFANIPAIFLSGILIPVGMLLLIVSMMGMYASELFIIGGVLNFLFQIVSVCCQFFSELLIMCNDIAFVEKFSYIHVVSPPLWSIFLYYGVLVLVSSETFRILYQRKLFHRIGAIAIVLAVVSWVSAGTLRDGFDDAELIFLDVGQGDCLFIRTDDGKTVMVDSGGSSTYDVGESVLLPFCLRNGIDRIDAAVITHFHTDHCKGLESLARLIPVEKLVLYEGNSVKASAGSEQMGESRQLWISEQTGESDRLGISKRMGKSGQLGISEQIGIRVEDFVYMAAGDKLHIGENLVIEALAPERMTASQYEALMSDSKDENGACLITKLQIEGVTVMMTGDIDTEGEQQLLERYAKASMNDGRKANFEGRTGTANSSTNSRRGKADDEEESSGEEVNFSDGGAHETSNRLQCDILKVAHHGSKYGTSQEFLNAVQPKLAVIQVGKNNYGHPSLETLARLNGIPTYRNDLHGAIGIGIENGVLEIRTMLGLE